MKILFSSCLAAELARRVFQRAQKSRQVPENPPAHFAIFV
jgi:hypothetical protein